MIMNTLFAETLKKLREKKGLSQIQLGNLMFVNNSTVARWESGLR
ncbi:MAG: helix-turn-helix transcriptional regulator, partial [Lachnospiraceae bacterium]|nr:helix-turn-helix transcriptional regulator [Lachnospiraceae bacterium]